MKTKPEKKNKYHKQDKKGKKKKKRAVKYKNKENCIIQFFIFFISRINPNFINLYFGWWL